MEQYLNYIGGKWIQPTDGSFYKHINPSNLECIGMTSSSTVEDANHAVRDANQAFEQWKQLSAVTRGDYLHRAADLLEAASEDIAITASKEMGKRLAETRGEVQRGAKILRYYAQEGMHEIGEVLPSAQSGTTLYTLRVPLGVVSVITPWNFPVAIPIWKIAPALVYGNTVVWKPAREAGITAVKIVEVFHQAGLPKGVLNLVTGSGSIVGDVLVKHPEIAAVTFTGSNAVGKEIAVKATSTNKKFQLELGGKNPAIVLKDADLGLAAKCIIDGAMKQTGQRCTATSRVYVEESVYERFVDQLISLAKEIKVGDALDSAIQMGPLASKNQFDTVCSYIAKGSEEGATVLYGGKYLADASLNNGYFVEPTIFADVNNDMTIAREEIFGPVLAVIKTVDYESAIVQANDSAYGLSASLFTNDISKAFHFIQNSEFGMVQINGETGGAEPQAPFGGMKESSSGTREQGKAAMEFFTAYKTVSISTSF